MFPEVSFRESHTWSSIVLLTWLVKEIITASQMIMKRQVGSSSPKQMKFEYFRLNNTRRESEVETPQLCIYNVSLWPVLRLRLVEQLLFFSSFLLAKKRGREGLHIWASGNLIELFFDYSARTWEFYIFFFLASCFEGLIGSTKRFCFLTLR